MSVENQQKWNDAVASGNLIEIKRLHYNKTKGCTKGAMNFAAINGHLEIVKFLHEFRTEGCTVDAMNLASSNCHHDIVEFLKNPNNKEITKETKSNSDKYTKILIDLQKKDKDKCLELIKFLQDNDYMEYVTFTN